MRTTTTTQIAARATTAMATPYAGARRVRGVGGVTMPDIVVGCAGCAALDWIDESASNAAIAAASAMADW